MAALTQPGSACSRRPLPASPKPASGVSKGLTQTLEDSPSLVLERRLHCVSLLTAIRGMSHLLRARCPNAQEDC